MDYDKILCDIFIVKETNAIRFKIHKIIKNNIYSNIVNYLINRFNDSSGINETLRRMQYKIYIHPKCPICNSPLKYIGKFGIKGLYLKHCSMSCRQKDPNVYLKQQNASINKYGSKNNIDKCKKTKLEKYGDSGYNNSEKSKLTWNNKSNEEIVNINNKRILTCNKKYKTDYYFQTEEFKIKTEKTKIKKYNNKTYNNVDKIKETKLNKYGDKNYNNSTKIQNTCLNRYGCKSGWNNDNQRKTIINIYGVDNAAKSPIIKEKIKETCFKKYRETSFSKTKQFKEILSFNKEEINKKRNITKQKNHTFNTSKPENESYKLLKEKYSDVIKQYSSNLYPFNCDFYIPSLDLYIECNYHWTHGGKPYENTKEDNLILEKWKSKNTKFYDNAIKCWTERDVNKRNKAKENNLNYVEFWDVEGLKCWLKELD